MSSAIVIYKSPAAYEAPIAYVSAATYRLWIIYIHLETNETPSNTKQLPLIDTCSL